jgi:Rho-associated protein kinase 1/Rho-associated protein kinase 2
VLLVLGAGAFAQVFLCRHIETRMLYAIKKIERKRLSENSWKIERFVLASCNSNWLVRLNFAFQDEEFLYLAMEFVPGGDFASLLQGSGNNFIH